MNGELATIAAPTIQVPRVARMPTKLPPPTLPATTEAITSQRPTCATAGAAVVVTVMDKGAAAAVLDALWPPMDQSGSCPGCENRRPVVPTTISSMSMPARLELARSLSGMRTGRAESERDSLGRPFIGAQGGSSRRGATETPPAAGCVDPGSSDGID